MAGKHTPESESWRENTPAEHRLVAIDDGLFGIHADYREELLDQEYAWYDENQGGTTLAEIVEMIEAAVRGSTVCGS